MMMTLADAHQLLPDAGLVPPPEGDLAGVHIQRVHTDTRTLRPGDLFLALKGERFDAHDFLPQAKAAGAVAVVAERGVVDCGLPGLLVADTRQALGDLAAQWRARLTLPLIAVTGSNGKTTVTQMVAEILRAWAGSGAHATQGNLNNEIGVPLTLLGLRAEHACAVVELGMNHPGEIAHLAGLAAPTVALVNNAQREHQEFMASVAAVAQENGAVISALDPWGIAVFPSDDEHTPLWRELAGPRKVLTFSDTAAADVFGSGVWQRDHWLVNLYTPLGNARLQLRVVGKHNLRNALAAAACAVAAGCPLAQIVAGLQAFEPVKGRSQVRSYTRGKQQVTLIDDSYNANPDSVRAAIDVLVSLPAPHWLVLGDMGEVGDQGPAFHREVGEYACSQGIEYFWTVGAQCAHAAAGFDAVAAPDAQSAARHFVQIDDALAALHAAPPAASVLVKGSRFMKMEKVVAALQSLDAAGGPHAA